MANVKAIIGKENYVTNVQMREHRLTVDLTEELKGQNKGARPMEILTASLASSIAVTLKSYINLKGWEIETITVDVEHKVKPDDRSNLFVVNIVFFKEIDEKRKARLKYIATSCPVYNMLASPNTELRTTISYYGK